MGITHNWSEIKKKSLDVCWESTQRGAAKVLGFFFIFVIFDHLWPKKPFVCQVLWGFGKFGPCTYEINNTTTSFMKGRIIDSFSPLSDEKHFRSEIKRKKI